MRVFLLLATACCLSNAAALHATAAESAWPAKPVRVIVPTAPGGGVDILARVFGQKLSESLHQPFVIENRGGAGGNIGTTLVAKSAPDGYTILFAPSSITISASLYRDPGYDVTRDLAAVTRLASTPYVLVTHPTLPVKTVRDLVALARKSPGQIAYASAGAGSASHLAGELFKKTAMIDMTHVPYKGIGPAVNDLVAGHVQVMFTGVPPVLGHIKAGKLRLLALAEAKRSQLLPGTPTISEAGYPGFVVENWVGVLTPARVPPEVIERLNREITRILGTGEVRERLTQLGFEPVGNSPGLFASEIRNEVAKWSKVIHEAGVHAD